MGALSVRGTWREGSVFGDPVGYERKALGTGICLHGAQLGNLEWAHLTRTEIWLRGALEVERLSLWELCEGNLEGGLPCWES